MTRQERNSLLRLDGSVEKSCCDPEVSETGIPWRGLGVNDGQRLDSDSLAEWVVVATDTHNLLVDRAAPEVLAENCVQSRCDLFHLSSRADSHDQTGPRAHQKERTG